MNLDQLSNRPAASVTDAEVEAALEMISENEHVQSAAAVGRDDLGRPIVVVEMEGLSGEYSLGRVISQIKQLAPKSAPYLAPGVAATNAKRNATRAANKKAKDDLIESMTFIYDDVHTLAHPKTRKSRLEGAAQDRIDFLSKISDADREEFGRVVLNESQWYWMCRMSTEEKLFRLRDMKSCDSLSYKR